MTLDLKNGFELDFAALFPLLCSIKTVVHCSSWSWCDPSHRQAQIPKGNLKLSQS